MEDYLIKKGTFKFSNILKEGYEFDEQPKIRSKSEMANGNIKVIYADHNSLTIAVKFGQLNGQTIKSYNDNFIDGQYEVWNPNTRNYESYNFIVTKGKKTLINSNHGEKYKEYDVILEKASEVSAG